MVGITEYSTADCQAVTSFDKHYLMKAFRDMASLRNLLLFALLIVSFGCSRSAGPDAMAPVGVGHPLPELVAAGWLNGSPPSREDLAGHVVVMDFWAYWCGPCRAEAPQLVQTYHRLRDREVIFLGLTAEGADALPETKAALAEANVPWPTGYGAVQLFDQLNIKMLPTKFVFGRDGRLAWHSFLPGTLEKAIDQALAAK